MIRYLKIKKPDTPEIREMVKKFCKCTGADLSQQESLIDRLSTFNVFGALNGELQGVCAYCKVGSKAVAEFLYVEKEYRNKNVGGRLYHFAKNHAKQVGLKTVVIFTRPETSNRYLKLGGYKVKFSVLEGDL